MREIKFRGKGKYCEYAGRWIYGYLYVYGKPKIYSILNENDVVTLNEFFGSCVPAFINVDPETIGQYTGQKDKNSVEIYDGDIVRTTYEEEREFNGVRYTQKMHFIEQVKWVDEDAGFFLLIYIEGIPMYRRMTLGSDYGKTRLVSIEVVGNIHDNPEFSLSLLSNSDDDEITMVPEEI